MKKQIILLVLLFVITTGLSAQLENIDPEYLKTLNSRANKIVQELSLTDSAQASRVQEIIVIQYYELSKIHDFRNTKLEEVKKLEDGAKEKEKNQVQTETDARLYKLHMEYLAKLSSELTQNQVEKVKDGMTYGVVERTYNGYLTLLPNLTNEQKRFIYKNLVEAREFAMDAGSSDEKHAWFGKYKGRINNYLSAAGIDMKKAEEELKARQK